jgi:CXXX repeat modification system protein
MKSTKVGIVSEAERDTIRQLYERRMGLKELVLVLAAVDSVDNELYEKLIRDMGSTSSSFDEWWQSMSEKYHWPGRDDGAWRIDFETCEIYLEASPKDQNSLRHRLSRQKAREDELIKATRPSNIRTGGG